MTSGLWISVVENVVFVLEFLGLVVFMFVVAYVTEKIAKKRRGDKERILSTRKMAMIGMFSAIAAILHVLDFPLPFIPDFYRLDFSELAALIGAFAFGPVAGVMIEFIKIVLKLLFKSTSTAFVGDLANYIIGCSFILPASIIYEFHKTKKSAMLGCGVGAVIMVIFGTVFNAVYLLPKFSVLYGIPLDTIIEMGAAVNGGIKDITSFVILAVAPMNIIKSGVASLLTLLVYKKLSPMLKTFEHHK